MLKLVDGYKTYTAGALIVIASAVTAFGVSIPEYVYTAIAGIGFVGIRDAVRKLVEVLEANKPAK